MSGISRMSSDMTAEFMKLSLLPPLVTTQTPRSKYNIQTYGRDIIMDVSNESGPSQVFRPGGESFEIATNVVFNFFFLLLSYFRSSVNTQPFVIIKLDFA